jgi:nicotinate-nucleotide pyrophosphorylase (carboxylating)
MKMINKFILDEIIINALKEDINYNDITSDLLIGDDHNSIAIVTFKEDGVFCGDFIARRIFELINKDVELVFLVDEGSFVKKSEDVMKIIGPTKDILKGERLMLNIIQRLSGIATLSKKYSDEAKGSNVKIVDTRKTTPNLRVIEKYAVKVGGCFIHRFNLSDSIMIKDNHIKAVGSINGAVLRAKSSIGHTVKIEVEVTSLGEFDEALDSGADIIMLDNMSLDDISEAVRRNDKRAILEVSGGVKLENIKNIVKTGIDVISVGALTHSYNALDISLNFFI